MEEFGLGVEEAPAEESPVEEAAPVAVEESVPEAAQETSADAQGEQSDEGEFGLCGEPQEDESKEAEEADSDEVPESYSFEGQDDAFNSSVGAVAKELGMTQKNAQKIASAIEDANNEFCLDALRNWTVAVRKDPEIGGANFDRSIAAVRGLFDRYATSIDNREELKEVFRVSGVGSHPEFIRMMYRISKDLPPAPGKRPLFPNSNMEK